MLSFEDLHGLRSMQPGVWIGKHEMESCSFLSAIQNRCFPRKRICVQGGNLSAPLLFPSFLTHNMARKGVRCEVRHDIAEDRALH